jgi:hypothetical protein
MDLVPLLLHLLVVCLVLGLLWWAANAVVGLLPAPVGNVARVILIVLAVLILVGWLLGEVGDWGDWGYGHHRRL